MSLLAEQAPSKEIFVEKDFPIHQPHKLEPLASAFGLGPGGLGL